MQRQGGVCIPNPKPTSQPRSGSCRPSSQLQQGGCLARKLLQTMASPRTPTPVPSRGSGHSPSGRVNSRKVGSDTTVWEMVCTGSSTQVTSLGRQDLMQRTVSVFSWRSLRGTTAQEAMGKVEPALPQRPGSGEKQVAGRDHLSQRWLRRRPTLASAARLLRGDASLTLLQTGPEPKPPRHAPVSVCPGWDKQSFAICQLYELSFSFYNCKSHSFVHLLNKCVLSICWVSGTRDTKANKGDRVRFPGAPGRGAAGVINEGAYVKHPAWRPAQSGQISGVTRWTGRKEKGPKLVTGLAIFSKPLYHKIKHKCKSYTKQRYH